MANLWIGFTTCFSMGTDGSGVDWSEVKSKMTLLTSRQKKLRLSPQINRKMYTEMLSLGTIFGQAHRKAPWHNNESSVKGFPFLCKQSFVFSSYFVYVTCSMSMQTGLKNRGSIFVQMGRNSQG